MHILLLGYCEVGRILAEDLRAQDHHVTAFDRKLATSADRLLARTTLSPKNSAP